MEANKRKISGIIKNTAILRIPFFQRKYVWDKEMWEEFLESMLSVSQKSGNGQDDYFMGSIILKEIDNGYGMNDIGLVVDGQQRLITTFLFFKELCKQQNRQPLFAERFYVSEGKEDSTNKKIGLEPSVEDAKFFNDIINKKIENIENDSYIKANEKEIYNSKIYQCYKFFMKKNLSKIDIEAVNKYICFVLVELKEKEDEQQVFDTINSLGVRLTTAELVKNYLFKNNVEGINEYKTYWQKTFENDNINFWESSITSGRQKKTNIDLFFQAFFDVYTAIYNKNLDSKNKFTPKTGSLSKKYRELFAEIGIKESQETHINFLKDIQEYAGIYKEKFNKDFVKENIESNIRKINVIVFLLNTTTFIFYILYIIKNSPDANKDKIFGLIVNYIMRRIICRASTKSYTNIFTMLINNDCNSYEKLNKWMHEVRDPTNLFPSNEELKKGFKESKVSNNNAKVVLYFIEKLLQGNEKNTLTLRTINKYEIEHVIPKKWEKNWGYNLNDVEMYRRSEYVNKIGNFTLVTESLNKSLTNDNWDTKKTGKEGKGGFLEYCKGVKTFEKYMQEKDWNEKIIDERADFLYEKGKEVWPLPLKPSEIK